DRRVGANRQDRPVRRLLEADGPRRLPRIVLGRAGGTGPSLPGHRARCRPVRRRGPGADRPRPGGGGRARPPSSGRQAGMIKVNLAPPTTKRPRRAAAAGPELNLGILFGGILAVLVLIIGGWWLAMSLEDRRLTAELEKRLNAIETVARNQARPVYLLDSMADTLPPDLWLTRLEERGPSLRIAGTTYSSVALSDFMANLKASGRFKDVDLVDAKQDLSKSPRTITFEVTCRFEI